MKRSIGLNFAACVLFIVLTGGCVSASTPTSVLPSPTFTPIPSIDFSLPTSTPTKLPTATPVPTLEQQEIVTEVLADIEHRPIVTEFLTDVEILSDDPFDKINSSIWNSDQFGNITDGVYELQATPRRTYLSPKEKFYGEGGIILKFRLQNANEKSAFTFDTGFYQTDSDKGFGIINGQHPHIALIQGKGALDYSDLYGNLSLKPDTWYHLLMAMETDENLDEKLLAVIWEPGDETHRVVYSTKMGKNWSDKAWIFYVRVSEGETMYIDDFYRISFGEIKDK